MAGRIDDEFCGWSVNVGVAGRYPLAAESSAVLDKGTGHDPTSLGVVVYDNITTLLVGTAAGHLLKVSYSLCLSIVPRKSDSRRLYNVPSLELRRLRADLYWCYKILFRLVAVTSDVFFTKNFCTSTHGHQYKLYKHHTSCFILHNSGGH